MFQNDECMLFQNHVQIEDPLEVQVNQWILTVH